MYLKQEEFPKYCIVEVTETDVLIASNLIDSYLGRSFAPKKFTDRVKLHKMRGKLQHAPVIVIEKVVITTPIMFGNSTQEGKVEDILLDPENDGYFTYVGGNGFNQVVFGRNPDWMSITYLSGYMEYPELLKVACGMLACNVHQAQSFQGAKELTSMDFSVKMSDDSFFTSDIRRLLKGLEHAGTF